MKRKKIFTFQFAIFNIKKILGFLGLIFILIPPILTKELTLKFSFPSPVPERPQKPKIDFQTLVEKTEMPIELRNFRIREVAEKEKRLVLKGLPRHVLEDKGNSFYSLIQKAPEGLHLKIDFFPKVSEAKGKVSDGNMLTLGFSSDDTQLSIFSGSANLPSPSSVIGGNLKKEHGLNTLYFELVHKRTFLTKDPYGLYNVSLFTDFEILRSLNILFDFNYLHLYSNYNNLNSISPKMEILFRPSNSWLLKGEFSYSFNHPLFEIEDPPFMFTPSNFYLSEPINSAFLSLSVYRFLFSDYSFGIKFSYKDIEKPFDSSFQKKEEFPLIENNGAFQSSLVFSKENGSGIRFSLSSGVIVPSLLLATFNPSLTDSTPPSPIIFTFSSILKGELEFSRTSFEIAYNWASFPYAFLSLKDIYSSKILLEQELPISKIIGGNIAIVIELRNFINFLKPPITDRYLLILYPRWIRGGVEVEF